MHACIYTYNGFRFEWKRARIRSHYPDLFNTVFFFFHIIRSFAPPLTVFICALFCYCSVSLFPVRFSLRLHVSNTSLPHIVTYLMFYCIAIDSKILSYIGGGGGGAVFLLPHCLFALPAHSAALLASSLMLTKSMIFFFCAAGVRDSSGCRCIYVCPGLYMCTCIIVKICSHPSLNFAVHAAEALCRREADLAQFSPMLHVLLLFVGCLTSQQYASVSQRRICSDNCTCCRTEIEVADPTFYLTQSQYTDAGPTSPSTDPITPGA